MSIDLKEELTTVVEVDAQDRVVICDWRQLDRFAVDALEAVGTRAEDAKEMARQIVDSEASGHESHGMRRLAEYVDRAQRGLAVPNNQTSIELDTGSLVRIHGDHGFGHVVLHKATKLAVQRAKQHGVACVAVRESEAAGRLAPFCDYAADQGIATVMFVNDSGAGQVVAPPGGTEARLSTNPIAAGVPRSAGPNLVIDIATSAVAMGRVSEERDRGTDLPEEWVGASGHLRPFGGIKGFALALIAEALAGGLTGAGTVRPDPGPERQGVLLLAIDVARFGNLCDFTSAVESFAEYVKDTPLENGADPIRLPGEGAAQTAKQRRRDGIPVRGFTWEQLRQLAAELDIRAL